MTTAEPWVRRDAEPYQPGNTAGLIHGGYSETAIAQRAVEVRRHLFTLAPHLADDPVYVVAVARFVRVESRAQLLDEAITAKAAAKGILAVGARILEAATATDRLAAKLGDDLGLSPLGRARLKAATATGELGEAAAAGLAELEATGRVHLDRQAVLDVPCIPDTSDGAET